MLESGGFGAGRPISTPAGKFPEGVVWHLKEESTCGRAGNKPSLLMPHPLPELQDHLPFEDAQRAGYCIPSSPTFLAEQCKKIPRFLSASEFVPCIGEDTREEQNNNSYISTCSISDSFAEGNPVILHV